MSLHVDIKLNGLNNATVTRQEKIGNEKIWRVKENQKLGIGYLLTAFFMVAQMAGAGFLALPRAIGDAGWSGIALMVIFGACSAFSGSRLGLCWIILEERWLEYRKTARQPYMEIAYRSLGKFGRTLTIIVLNTSIIGTTIVFIILISDIMNNLLPEISQCGWSVISFAVLLPLTWLESPKDFWQTSVLAVVVTVIAIVGIIAKILIDMDIFLNKNPNFASPTLSSFFLAFGAILFSYGGCVVIPTIQNDMRKKTDFWKSTIISFTVIILMYLPVAVIGYVAFGSDVNSNILLSIGTNNWVMVVMALQVINLAGTFIISMNPVSQCFEDVLQVPQRFCWQRVLVRSGIMAFNLFIALAIPDFGLVINLVGGATITCLSFIFPGLMYMKLVDNATDESWPRRHISTLERTILWIIILIGILGGISSTISATNEILQPSAFSSSCFGHFY